jgi:hypothetical protein
MVMPQGKGNVTVLFGDATDEILAVFSEQFNQRKQD